MREREQYHQAPKDQKRFSGIRCIMKGSKKENGKVKPGGENVSIPSVFRKEETEENRMRASDAVQSWAFVTASQCHVLFVLGQTERTCPPLLREAAPHCCWVYEWKIISHLYWFLISCLVLFAQENEKDVLLLYSNARKKKFRQRLQKCFWDRARLVWFHFPPFAFLLPFYSPFPVKHGSMLMD